MSNHHTFNTNKDGITLGYGICWNRRATLIQGHLAEKTESGDRVSAVGLFNVSSQQGDETPKIAFSRPAEFI
ncbi:hypothetical protein [Nostoc sp.]|uniref:hypothetical protein n=1 Tax=Nostoc sp. TaxID=1180 RepID=UPI002FF6F343